MARRLDGKVAIVTGASSGLGWQTAVRLAGAGAKVCVVARRTPALEELAESLRGRGGKCLVAPGDVTVQADVERVVDSCLRHFGRVDLLVNGAAVRAYGHFEQLHWDQITRILDVVALGPMRLARAVLPHFRRQGAGQILNVASLLSLRSAPLQSAYAAAEHALLAWSDALRLELRGTGIDVSTVLLPSLSTPMYDHAATRLGLVPRPVPPVWETDRAARAVVRCVRRPRARYVPLLMPGSLLCWLDRRLPRAGDAVLGRWGARLQVGERAVDRPRGNLFEPVGQGVGPRGSIGPTPRWKRWVATAALLSGAGVAGLWVARAARAASRSSHPGKWASAADSAGARRSRARASRARGAK